MSDNAQEQIITIPWQQLHDSPLQYRQTYSEAAIDEIAATITDTGRIHQPLVVRLRYPNPLFADAYDPQDGYEIVFGHTRKRAGMKAGLEGAPCIVRVMTDAQVRAAQVAENVARADVHPLEEAQGFRAMIDEDGITADALASTLGKSRSYVYGRLKLLALCPEVRKAVLAGEVGTEVGLLIARVGNATLQGKALGYIRGKAYDLGDGGKRSFRNIRDLLNERFTLSLKTAIFPPDDYSLLPSAGECELCPKRSGNDPTFDDVTADDGARRHSRVNSGPDVCTDPDCFDAKKRAHLARQAATLEATGKVVLTGNKARQAVDAYGKLKGDYIDASKVRDALKKANEGKRGADKVAMPQVVLVQDQRTGRTIEAVKRAEVPKVAATAEPVRQGRPGYASSMTPAESNAYEARREAEAQQLADGNAQRRALLTAVRQAVQGRPRDLADLQAAAGWMVERMSSLDAELVASLWGQPPDADAEDQLQDLALNLGPDDLVRLVLDIVLVDNVVASSHYWLEREQPLALLATAERYGIELPSTPSTAARAATGAAAGAGAGLDDDPGDGDPDEYDDEATGQADGAGAAGAEQMDNAAGCAAGGSDAEAGALTEGAAA